VLQVVETVDGDEIAPTLPALLGAIARSGGERDFLTLNDRRVTYADADRISAEWARGLLALGAGKAARIGLLMPNGPDWVLAFLAGARAGALTVTLSTFYQAPEISWGVRHNDVDTLLICDRYLNHDYIERLERALPGLSGHTTPDLYLPTHPYLRRIIVWGDCDRPWALKGPQALSQAAAKKPQIDAAFLSQVEANIAPADALAIICTSGSTAEPKAVVHTHGAALRAVHKFAHYLDLQAGDRSYSGQPFFWIGGLNMNLLPSMFLGACICFSDSPAPADIAKTILAEKVTRLSLWPAQVAGLIDYARREGVRFESIRVGMSAIRDKNGKVIPKERRAAGAMGMTESFGMHSMEVESTPAPPGKGGNWGRRVPGVERRVVDPKTRRPLPVGEIGELEIRGFTLMQGYYKREREEAFLPDGFFATGDLAALDEDDYVYFHGRNTEMIKTSGANVAPREVEIALQALRGVKEAIVFAIPDPVKGEIVCAFVVPGDDAPADPAALQAGLRTEISAYKIPQEMAFIAWEDVPRTGSLKPLKNELRAMMLERIRARGGATQEPGR
jgi:acyl-CoA synthetase (AMP-forming)/AMP-acid ligase II